MTHIDKGKFPDFESAIPQLSLKENRPCLHDETMNAKISQRKGVAITSPQIGAVVWLNSQLIPLKPRLLQ